MPHIVNLRAAKKNEARTAFLNYKRHCYVRKTVLISYYLLVKEGLLFDLKASIDLKRYNKISSFNFNNYTKIK